MPSVISPINRQSWLLSIKGLDFMWETFSGISETSDTAQFSDGLSNRLYKLQGPRSLDDFTFEKAFDPVRDKPIIQYWKNFCSGETEPTTASITPVRYCPTPEQVPGSAILILYGVIPIQLSGFQVDRKSSDVSMLTLVVAAEEWAYA